MPIFLGPNLGNSGPQAQPNSLAVWESLHCLGSTSIFHIIIYYLHRCFLSPDALQLSACPSTSCLLVRLRELAYVVLSEVLVPISSEVSCLRLMSHTRFRTLLGSVSRSMCSMPCYVPCPAACGPCLASHFFFWIINMCFLPVNSLSQSLPSPVLILPPTSSMTCFHFLSTYFF